jgi:hypothetical protein
MIKGQRQHTGEDRTNIIAHHTNHLTKSGGTAPCEEKAISTFLKAEQDTFCAQLLQHFVSFLLVPFSSGGCSVGTHQAYLCTSNSPWPIAAK